MVDICDVLDILLPVQEQPQKGAQEVLNAFPWDMIDNIALQLLRSKRR